MLLKSRGCSSWKKSLRGYGLSVIVRIVGVNAKNVKDQWGYEANRGNYGRARKITWNREKKSWRGKLKG